MFLNFMIMIKSSIFQSTLIMNMKVQGIEDLIRLLKCFQEKINTRSNLLVNNLSELQEEAKASHLTFLGQKVAEDIGDGQAAYKELLKNMGYRLWVSRLTISKGENKHDITLNLENSRVAPLYGDWTVVLYLCDASGKVVQSQDLDCRLSELLPDQTTEGFDVVLVDDFSNSSPAVLERLEKITGKKFPFYQGSILDTEFLDKVFTKEDIELVIHFAAFKAVGESVQKPLKYYKNNISGTITLLEKMKEYDVKNIVFSSSATVYGTNNPSPMTEDMPTSAINPYGYTKLMMEQILTDVAASDPSWSVTNLRYFNPIGAHESGLIGELPNGIPNNLMPYITQVAIGKLPELNVFGDDYPTPDGTGVRDYIHVLDLASGHLAAVKYNLSHKGAEIFNLGTGHGYSVLDLVKTFEAENKVTIPYRIQGRRAGDIATCYASPEKAKEVLGWEAKKTLKDMVRDSWRWQTTNPNGYED